MLILTSSFPRFQGDFAGSFVLELGDALKRKDLNIIFLAPHYPGIKLKEILQGMEVYRFPYFYPLRYQKLFRDGGFVYNLKISTLAKIEVPLFFVSELVCSLIIARRKKVDIIHSHWLLPQGLIGALIKKYLSIPHLLTIHAADVLLLENLPFHNLIADFIFMNSDAIIAVSSYISDRFSMLVSPNHRNLLESKIIVLPMGIHISDFASSHSMRSISDNKTNLLYLGRLSEKKGICYLIQAMKLLVPQMDNLVLYICGEGPLRGELEGLVDNLNLRAQIRFTGYVTPKEKETYLSIADILIVPSIVIESGETEGLPVVVLEGMAAGKPIIASDVSGIGDIIKDGYNGFLIESKRPDLIAERVLSLMANKDLQKVISDKALETIEAYDWDKISCNYKNIISKIYT